MSQKSSTPKTAGPAGSGSTLITLWVPNPYVPVIKSAVKRKDTDRSKWIREAMREKAEREGFPIPQQ